MKAFAIFEKLAGRQRERQESRSSDFRQLVVQIADDNEPEVEWIDEVLEANGKTVRDLQEAVERLQRRRELKVQVDQEAKLEKEVQRIESEIAEADRIYEEASRLHDETVDPLLTKLKQAKTRLYEVPKTRQALLESCEDEDLCRQFSELEPQLSESEKHLEMKEVKARNCRSEAGAHLENAQAAKREPNRDYHRDEADRYIARAEQLESELPALRRQVKALQRKDKALRKKMLVP